MRWTLLGLLVCAAIAATPARAQVAADPACPPAVPAAMVLTGVPAVAVIGRSYTLGLDPSGAADAYATVGRNGSTLGVHDRVGRGWSAHYEYLTGVQQAFSVGIAGAPFLASGSYSEALPSGGTCTRTLSTALPIE